MDLGLVFEAVRSFVFFIYFCFIRYNRYVDIFTFFFLFKMLCMNMDMGWFVILGRFIMYYSDH